MHITLIQSLAERDLDAQLGTVAIFCPWLNRSEGEFGIWRSVLAVHDLNGILLGLPGSSDLYPNVYAAVLAVDPFRTPALIAQHLRRIGIPGVINFPSVSFFDGNAGGVFNSLYLW